jgi:hypothetical protein
VISVNTTIQSTTTSTGSLIVSGGVGIIKDTRIGGDIYIGGVGKCGLGGRNASGGTSGGFLSVQGSTFTDNTTTTSGTLNTMAFASFGIPTLSALNPSVTTTNAATVYIGGSPIQGSNETITNGYGLWVDAGATRLDGDVICNGGLTALGTYIQSWGLVTTNVEESTSTTSGTITTSGGVGIAKNVNVGGHVTSGYATTETVAGTTTMTVSSAERQFFTGTTTQTVVLPVVSTLNLGFIFEIVNLSTGTITVQSSGANTISTVTTNTRKVYTCIMTTGTGSASWTDV